MTLFDIAAGPAPAVVAFIVAAIALTVVAMRLAAPAARRRERVLVLGSGETAREVIRALHSPHYAVTGVAPDPGVPDPFGHFEALVKECRPHRIVVAFEERRSRLPVDVLMDARLRGILVEDAQEACERLSGRIAVERLQPGPVIFGRTPSMGPLQRAATRALGVLVASAGLVVSAPLLAIVALAVRLESPGSALFVQERVGKDGRRFGLIKLRTMRPAHRVTSEWIGDNACRLTRVGAWLRRFHIDELPQFVNVLRGDMDLVGPRPHPIANFELFSAGIPHYRLRLTVRPGITGWAQIRYGYANNLDEEIEKMRYDLYYIRHRSLWLDVRILAHTAVMLLLGRGSEAAAARRGSAPAIVAPVDHAA